MENLIIYPLTLTFRSVDTTNASYAETPSCCIHIIFGDQLITVRIMILHLPFGDSTPYKKIAKYDITINTNWTRVQYTYNKHIIWWRFIYSLNLNIVIIVGKHVLTDCFVSCVLPIFNHAAINSFSVDFYCTCDIWYAV